MSVPLDKQLEELKRIKATRANVLEDFVADCDFPLSQGYSLQGTPDSVSQGVCWAMSYDWARFQVYDYQVGGRRFYNIRKKTRLLQLFLNKARQKQELLRQFAKREGFEISLLAEGTVADANPNTALPIKFEVVREIIVAAFEPVIGDTHGIRLIGFDSDDGGHEIAVKVRPPFRFFDPNFGQFTLGSKGKLEELMRKVLLRQYIDLMNSWDVCVMRRAFPEVQNAQAIPAHVAGRPPVAHGDVDADVEAMLLDLGFELK